MGEYRFPNGDAAAIRTMSLARAFRDLGLDVTVVGKGQPIDEHFDPVSGWHVIEGIRYTTIRPGAVGRLQILLEWKHRVFQFAHALDHLKLDDCEAVLINACDSARHVPIVLSYCRKRAIPVIADICEWYDPRQVNGGWLNPFYILFNVVFHWVFPRIPNMITVSKLLEQRFSTPQRNLVRIAAPIDTTEIPSGDCTDSTRLVLLYAGAAGRKDLLAEILIALGLLDDTELDQIEFRLLGPTHEDLASLLGQNAKLLDRLRDVVHPKGRVPRTDVLRHLREAHFSVLFRPDLRYASAGFPSKVPESLAAGTPVLLNLTGDLGVYLADEKASIVASSPSPSDIADAIRRALRLSPEQRRIMRIAAREKAEMHFDFRRALPQLRKLLGQLR